MPKAGGVLDLPERALVSRALDLRHVQIPGGVVGLCIGAKRLELGKWGVVAGKGKLSLKDVGVGYPKPEGHDRSDGADECRL